jgi:uncharacterized membrane protein YqiK
MSEENPQTPPEAKTFSLEYVRELREENKGLRLAKTNAERAAEDAKAEAVKAKTDAEAAVAAAKADAEAKVKEADTRVSDGVAAAQKAADDRVISAELRTAATAAGMKDLDGLKLADLSSVKLNAEGKVEGADALLTSLKEAKPYLFGEPARTTTTQTAPPPAPNALTGKKAGDWTPEQMKQAELALAAGRPIPNF